MMINQFWACEENALRDYLEAICFSEISEEKFQAFFNFEDASEKVDVDVNGDIASFNIKGILTKTGLPPIARVLGFEGTSYNEIVRALNRISEDDSVKEIHIFFDTPGGDVNGLDEVAQLIGALSRKKRAIAFNTGMIASAGYWLASQTNEIVSTAPSNLVGSIGVVISQVDRSSTRVVNVISKNAPLKRASVNTEKGLAELQRRADAVERIFISRIAEGRKVSEEKIISDFGKGGLLISKDPDSKMGDAMSVGMIDKVEGIKNVTTAEIFDNDNVSIINSNEEIEDDNIIGGSTTFKDFPIADKPWDATAAIKRVRSATGSTEKPSVSYKNAFFWFDAADKENFGAYKLPFADIVDGKMHAVRRGIFAANAAMAGARGGVKIPSSDRAAVQRHIDRYRTKIEKQDKQKEKTMSLKDLLGENPGLAAELKQLKEEAYDSGYKAKQMEFDKVSDYLTSDSYPKQIKVLGFRALKGEMDLGAFLGAVGAYDAIMEKSVEDKAIEQTKENGETKAQQLPEISKDGIVRSDNDIETAIAETKKYLV